MDGGIGPGLAVLIPHSWREWAVTSIGGDVYVHGWDVWKKGAIPVATASAVRPQITPPPGHREPPPGCTNATVAAAPLGWPVLIGQA